MNKFLVRLLLFSTLLFLLIFLMGIEIEKKDYESDYMAAMIDKHNKLDKTTGPRLIFAGGSSTSFGVDSKKIEKEFNIPVTNLAMVAGLGLDFMLNEIETKMREGDIVILSTEYYLEMDGSYELKLYTAKCFPDANQYFRHDYVKDLTTVKFKQIKNNFGYLIERLFKRSQSAPDTATDFTTAFIHRSAFNEYGDMVGHIGKRPPPKLFYRNYIPYHYYEGIERMNKFYETAQKKKVKIFFVYNAYAKSTYNLNEETIKKYHSDLVKDLKIPIIGQPGDFIYDDSLFFDTTYHLAPEGRELRTQKLIQLLKTLNCFK